MATYWGYTKSNGPDTWGRRYSMAKGENQSPVDIITDSVVHDKGLSNSPLRWDHKPSSATMLVNTGHDWRVKYAGADTSYLRGGPLLQGSYQLEEVVGHWGRWSDRGSEHSVDGRSFPAELQVTFWNTKYFSYEEARTQKDGLAILAIFLTVGEENYELGKVVELMQSVRFMGQSVKMDSFNLEALLPDDHSYWTYPGSLTAPPCYECVTWIVFQNPVIVSWNQIRTFRLQRTIKIDGHPDPDDEYDGFLMSNVRPKQPLNGRVVRGCEQHCTLEGPGKHSKHSSYCLLL